MSSSLSNDVPLNDDAANTNTNDDEDDDSFDMSIMDPVDNEKKQLFDYFLSNNFIHYDPNPHFKLTLFHHEKESQWIN